VSDDDLADRLTDLEARVDALNRARTYLQDRVDELEAENERLRERVADLEGVVDSDIVHSNGDGLAAIWARDAVGCEVHNSCVDATGSDEPAVKALGSATISITDSAISGSPRFATEQGGTIDVGEVGDAGGCETPTIESPRDREGDGVGTIPTPADDPGSSVQEPDAVPEPAVKALGGFVAVLSSLVVPVAASVVLFVASVGVALLLAYQAIRSVFS